MLSLNERIESFRYHLYTISDPNSTEDDVLDAFKELEVAKDGSTLDEAKVLKALDGCDVYTQFVNATNDLNAVVMHYWYNSTTDSDRRIEETYNHTKNVIDKLCHFGFRKVLYCEDFKFAVGGLLRGNLYWYMRNVFSHYRNSEDKGWYHEKTGDTIIFTVSKDDLEGVKELPHLYVEQTDTDTLSSRGYEASWLSIPKEMRRTIESTITIRRKIGKKSPDNTHAVSFQFFVVHFRETGQTHIENVALDFSNKQVITALLRAGGSEW